MPEMPMEGNERNSENEQGNDIVKLGIKEVLDKIGFGFGSRQVLMKVP